MALTQSVANKVLNHLFRNTTMPSPTAVFVGLYVGSAEVGGATAGYARQSITFGAPTAGVIKNDTEVRFPIASSDWGEISSAGIFDAATGGNRLDDASIAAVRIVRANDQFVIPVGNYTIEVK